MIERNHKLLNELGVGHKALDQVCEVTKKHQLMTKLTGAGGGGCALTLCPSGVQEETLKNAKKELEELGYQCFQTDIAGKGYLVHDMSSSENVLKTLFPTFKL